MRILIIEDEARIAKRLVRMTNQYFEHAPASLTVCDSLSKGINFIQANEIDILLLDLNLNGEDGFDVLQSMVSRPFHTIIVSAYTDKAITAFFYGVLDFVPKPFDEARLFQAFKRLSAKEKPAEISLKYLAVRRSGNITLIDISTVRYINGAGIYSELNLQNDKSVLHDKSLDALEQILPPQFMRIHRSYIVSLTEAKKLIIQPGSRYSLQLHNGELIPVGRLRYKALKEKMG
ncbi:response regulator transcription factor [Mucilaginibacter limnophilus]|uniref:Response regulator transcription factor n=1 Tax=Mucilaginibacter limnophilus TaxID=1932778 RepID=A0A3S2V9M6_9SPHI|nr:LytTR family DNA-binding domain-containing protein [Mucilaginibacter limnophilus]RVU02086.1 response regulator transcription factor [Mucilaginibacter limnophilus]